MPGKITVFLVLTLLFHPSLPKIWFSHPHKNPLPSQGGSSQPLQRFFFDTRWFFSVCFAPTGGRAHPTIWAHPPRLRLPRPRFRGKLFFLLATLLASCFFLIWLPYWIVCFALKRAFSQSRKPENQKDLKCCT